MHHADSRNGVVLLPEIRQQCGLQSRKGKLVDAKRAEERVRAHAGDEVGSPGDEACLRSTEKLVATVSNDVDAQGEAIGNAWFVLNSDRTEIEECTRAEVFH